MGSSPEIATMHPPIIKVIEGTEMALNQGVEKQIYTSFWIQRESPASAVLDDTLNLIRTNLEYPGCFVHGWFVDRSEHIQSYSGIPTPEKLRIANETIELGSFEEIMGDGSKRHAKMFTVIAGTKPDSNSFVKELSSWEIGSYKVYSGLSAVRKKGRHFDLEMVVHAQEVITIEDERGRRTIALDKDIREFEEKLAKFKEKWRAREVFYEEKLVLAYLEKRYERWLARGEENPDWDIRLVRRVEDILASKYLHF